VTRVLEELGAVDVGAQSSSPVELRDVLGLPGLVTVSTAETLLDAEELAALGGLAREALAQLVEMRQREGERLRAQIEAELEKVQAFIDWFEPRIEGFRAGVLERLQERMAELLGDQAAVEPERLAQEAALQADRSDVAEEVVRLRSHLETFSQRLDHGGAVGRALDFLCQELNRELNTLASKCRELGVAERLVDARTATERIREQVQNLE
jgi:uncharacterized protein (TIGR00255 family)